MENETPATPKKGISPILIGLIIVILVVGGAAGYTMMQKQQAQHEMSENEQMEGMEHDATTSGDATSPVPSEAMAVDTSVKTIEVSGSSFKFSPSTISVKQGDKIKIVFKNTGGFHDFVIEGMTPKVATKQIQSGETDTVEFTATTKGTFKYYCSVGNHRKMGMEGTLTVE